MLRAISSVTRDRNTSNLCFSDNSNDTIKNIIKALSNLKHTLDFSVAVLLIIWPSVYLFFFPFGLLNTSHSDGIVVCHTLVYKYIYNKF